MSTGGSGPTVPEAPLVPRRTERLLLRALEAADVEPLWRYRNDPEVALHQDWELPYPRASAERLVAAVAHLDVPVRGDWLQIGVEHDGGLVGDVAVQLAEEGATATIGYTLATEAQGRGFATEAVGAVVAWLLGPGGVDQVVALVDPANGPSIRLLQRLGFGLESHRRAAVEVRGRVADENRYVLPAP